jgi:hypothetical protein
MEELETMMDKYRRLVNTKVDTGNMEKFIEFQKDIEELGKQIYMILNERNS